MFDKEWEEQDIVKGETDQKRTMDQLVAAMSSIMDFIQFESKESDYRKCKMPGPKNMTPAQSKRMKVVTSTPVVAASQPDQEIALPELSPSSSTEASLNLAMDQLVQPATPEVLAGESSDGSALATLNSAVDLAESNQILEGSGDSAILAVPIYRKPPAYSTGSSFVPDESMTLSIGHQGTAALRDACFLPADQRSGAATDRDLSERPDTRDEQAVKVVSGAQAGVHVLGAAAECPLLLLTLCLLQKIPASRCPLPLLVRCPLLQMALIAKMVQCPLPQMALMVHQLPQPHWPVQEIQRSHWLPPK